MDCVIIIKGCVKLIVGMFKNFYGMPDVRTKDGERGEPRLTGRNKHGKIESKQDKASFM